ncbi:Succinate-semialdehyde dehydrogenase [Raphanus sativus]|nr:Succinate-semialdehyde dehydrogenase [Raphanus sativus]
MQVGPALTSGYIVVVKASELNALKLALQAGVPPGDDLIICKFQTRCTLNVVMGNAPEIGDALLTSSQVRKITFTGLTAVGKKLPLIRFKTEEDAIGIANDTIAGLATYIFTNCVQRSWHVSEALEYRLVGGSIRGIEAVWSWKGRIMVWTNTLR